jgi:hypothetical protein
MLGRAPALQSQGPSFCLSWPLVALLLYGWPTTSPAFQTLDANLYNEVKNHFERLKRLDGQRTGSNECECSANLGYTSGKAKQVDFQTLQCSTALSCWDSMHVQYNPFESNTTFRRVE